MSLNKNSGGNNATLIVLKTSTHDENDNKVNPFFIASRKVGEDWVNDKDTFTSIVGDISRIDVLKTTYEGKDSQNVRVYLEDKEANEKYLLSLRLNFLNRDIVNKLLGLPSLDKVEISLYTNKNDYATSAVRQAGNLTKWKFGYEELPKPIEILHPKSQQLLSRDYSEIDDLFADAAREFAEKFSILGVKKETPSTQEAKEPERESKELDDDAF